MDYSEEDAEEKDIEDTDDESDDGDDCCGEACHATGVCLCGGEYAEDTDDEIEETTTFHGGVSYERLREMGLNAQIPQHWLQAIRTVAREEHPDVSESQLTHIVVERINKGFGRTNSLQMQSILPVMTTMVTAALKSPVHARNTE